MFKIGNIDSIKRLLYCSRALNTGQATSTTKTNQDCFEDLRTLVEVE